MPYCTDCGNEVRDTHSYCRQCGTQLTEGQNSGPASTAEAPEVGFLTHESMEYLKEALEAGTDEEHPGHASLMRDVAAAFQDFAVIGKLDELNLLEILASGAQSETYNETETELMLLGFFRTVRLYDESFGTDWEDELLDQLTRAIDQAKADLEDESL